MDRQFDEASTVFGNYKPLQGVQTPFSVVQYRNDEMSAQRFLTSATYNTSSRQACLRPRASRTIRARGGSSQ